MSDHRCRRTRDGICGLCGLPMPVADRHGSYDLDSWRDPETIDRSFDDNPDDLAYLLASRRYGRP